MGSRVNRVNKVVWGEELGSLEKLGPFEELIPSIQPRSRA
jgi:hypothetical protein